MDGAVWVLITTKLVGKALKLFWSSQHSLAASSKTNFHYNTHAAVDDRICTLGFFDLRVSKVVWQVHMTSGYALHMLQAS